jgi:hypothetical protein
VSGSVDRWAVRRRPVRRPGCAGRAGVRRAPPTHADVRQPRWSDVMGMRHRSTPVRPANGTGSADRGSNRPLRRVEPAARTIFRIFPRLSPVCPQPPATEVSRRPMPRERSDRRAASPAKSGKPVHPSWVHP